MKPLSAETVFSNSLLAVQTDLFQGCDVDDEKYTIEDGCEPGIAIFCRNAFFPALDPIGATVEQFSEICDCINFLCASLPSGEDATESLLIFKKTYYVLLTMPSSLALLVYLASVADLCSSGDLNGCTISHLFTCLL